MERNITTLKHMYHFVDSEMSENDYQRLKGWDLSWPLLRMVIYGQVTIDGMTEKAWIEMTSFYEHLTEVGMPAYECPYCKNSDRLVHATCILLYDESI